MMTLSSLAAILSSCFTALSVLVAIVVFKRNEDRTTFTKFRLALVDIRHTFRQLDRALSEPLFSELSRNVVGELELLFQEQHTPDDFKQFMLDSKNHDYIAQAIHAGRLNSQQLREISRYVSDLQRAPFEFKDTLPAVFMICRSLLPYLLQTADRLISPKFFDQVVGDPEVFTDLILPQIDGIDDTKVMYRKLSVVLAGACGAILMGQGQAIIDESEKLLETLIDNYSRMSDSELRRELRAQKERHRTSRRSI